MQNTGKILLRESLRVVGYSLVAVIVLGAIANATAKQAVGAYFALSFGVTPILLILNGRRRK